MLGAGHISSLPSTPTLAWELVEKLLDQGHEIFIITTPYIDLPKNSYPLERMQIFPLLPTAYSPLERAVLMIKLAPSIIRQIRRINPDVLHTYGDITMGYFSVLLKILTNKTSITTITRNWVGGANHPALTNILSIGNWGSNNQSIFSKQKRFFLFLLDHIICGNNYLKEQIGGKGSDSHKISVIPYGIKKAFLNNLNSKNIELEKNDNKIILFWGDGSYMRGFYVFLFSIEHVLNKFPNTQFIAAIRGMEEVDSINLQTAANKIKKRLNNLKIIERTLSHSSTINMIKSSHIVVLPFIMNAMEPPLTIIESMYLGKPVITSNVGGNREIINNMENGILINPDPENLTKAIMTLLLDDRKRDEIGQLAQKTIMKKYNWNKCATKVVEIYKRIANN
jgi:glycosyltransferase involved in cell wall biosynthesis|tara:strand:- start:220 stop:1404 length:1185 start_codon:yes stop_codon:yes gene_type:complete